MNKVMNRAQRRHRHPGSRPPGRHDSRRPSAAPPRGPGAFPAARTPVPGDRPPATPARPAQRRTRPLDTRPSGAPAGTPASAAARTVPARRAEPRPRLTDLFAERLLAVLSGRRPVHFMLRHTVGRAYDDLARLAEHGPLRARGTRPVVRDIGWFEPRPGAVEVFARIGAGEQLRAMAFRLEYGTDLRWRCTAVELGGPRPPRGDDD
ncbi:Rv3235 family protein [Streptomyces griseoviridis]|nr:Rv3235 family protein [Streptomyces griseoviridis]GGT18916.1 hypothetical protein GCM10010240_59920 [Streptomyces griseoviridis]